MRTSSSRVHLIVYTSTSNDIIIYIFIFVDDFIIMVISKHIRYYTFKIYLYALYLYNHIIFLFFCVDDLRHLTAVRKVHINSSERMKCRHLVYIFQCDSILIHYLYTYMYIWYIFYSHRRFTAFNSCRKELHNKFAEKRMKCRHLI
jgi:hypothetical protein